MSLPLKQLLIASSLAFLGPDLEAQEPKPEVFRGRVSALESHIFRIGELKVQIWEFKFNRIFRNSQVVFKLENLGSNFLAVSAQDLVIVGHNGRQILEGTPQEKLGAHLLPQGIRIAPRAHVILTLYPEDHSVNYPAKLYFGERFLAEITE